MVTKFCMTDHASRILWSGKMKWNLT